MAALPLAVGDVITMPFHENDDDSPERYPHRIESFGRTPSTGEPGARLVRIDIHTGERMKTSQGHFRRSWRSLAEIERVGRRH